MSKVRNVMTKVEYEFLAAFAATLDAKGFHTVNRHSAKRPNANLDLEYPSYDDGTVQEVLLHIGTDAEDHVFFHIDRTTRHVRATFAYNGAGVGYSPLQVRNAHEAATFKELLSYVDVEGQKEYIRDEEDGVVYVNEAELDIPEFAFTLSAHMQTMLDKVLEQNDGI